MKYYSEEIVDTQITEFEKQFKERFIDGKEDPYFECQNGWGRSVIRFVPTVTSVSLPVRIYVNKYAEKYSSYRNSKTSFMARVYIEVNYSTAGNGFVVLKEGRDYSDFLDKIEFLVNRSLEVSTGDLKVKKIKDKVKEKLEGFGIASKSIYMNAIKPSTITINKELEPAITYRDTIYVENIKENESLLELLELLMLDSHRGSIEVNITFESTGSNIKTVKNIIDTIDGVE